MEVAVFVLCALHILSIQLQELPKILLQNGKAPVCGLPAEMEKKKDMKIQTEIAAVLLAAAVAALLLYRRHKRRQYPYRQKFLLTKTEYAFYKILEEKMYKKRTVDMSQSTSGGFYIRYRNEKYRKIQRVYQIQTC